MRIYSPLSLRFLSILSSFFLLVISFKSLIPQAQAMNMINNSYILDTSPSSTGSAPRINSFNNTNAPGYSIKEGFDNLNSNSFLSESISTRSIDFGSINSGSPLYRTDQISTSNGSAYGVVVTAQESHPLVNASGSGSIPDTTCDNGVCSSSTSDQWSNVLTYGFGYRCDNLVGNSCAPGFTNESYFKDFASSPNTMILLSSTDMQPIHAAQITYKVNVSPTQPNGIYNNDVIYIILSKF